MQGYVSEDHLIFIKSNYKLKEVKKINTVFLVFLKFSLISPFEVIITFLLTNISVT